MLVAGKEETGTVAELKGLTWAANKSKILILLLNPFDLFVGCYMLA